MSWVVPLARNSQHQDFYMFRRGSLETLHLPLLLGKRPTQIMTQWTPYRLFFLVRTEGLLVDKGQWHTHVKLHSEMWLQCAFWSILWMFFTMVFQYMWWTSIDIHVYVLFIYTYIWIYPLLWQLRLMRKPVKSKIKMNYIPSNIRFRRWLPLLFSFFPHLQIISANLVFFLSSLDGSKPDENLSKQNLSWLCQGNIMHQLIFEIYTQTTTNNSK